MAEKHQWEVGVHLGAGRDIVERVAKLDNCSETTIAQGVSKYRDYYYGVARQTHSERVTFKDRSQAALGLTGHGPHLPPVAVSRHAICLFLFLRLAGELAGFAPSAALFFPTALPLLPHCAQQVRACRGGLGNTVIPSSDERGWGSSGPLGIVWFLHYLPF